MTPGRICVVASILACAASPAGASFHLVQIEQVIGGVGGDNSVQAIQLRFRFTDECFLAPMQLWAHDATGANPVLLFDFVVCPASPDPCATDCAGGARVLLATPGFAGATNPALTPDFTLLAPIPASDLAAGSMTYQLSSGEIMWRLSWGGAAYSGPNDGQIFNDLDGDFGPPWPGALPSAGAQALQFPGLETDDSTTNAADYALTAGAAVFTNNAGQSATVRLPCPWDCADGDGTVGVVDFLALLGQWGNAGACDLDGSGVAVTDFLALLGHWGTCP